MAQTQWLNLVVPKVAPVMDAQLRAHDPFFDGLMKGSGSPVDLNGSMEYKIPRSFGRAGLPQLSDATHTMTTFETLPGLTNTTVNVLEMKLSCAMLNIELRRMDATQLKTYVQAVIKRLIVQHYIAMKTRFYSGSVPNSTLDAPYLQLPTLNGGKTDCTTPGLANGLIKLQAPASQTGTYLFARQVDSTGMSNWYNQGAQFTTSQDFVIKLTNLVRKADEFSEEMSDSPNPFDTRLVMSYDTWDFVNGAARYTSGSGFPTIVYTAADAKSGNIHNAQKMIAGVPALPSRFFDDTQFAGVTYPMLGVTSKDFQWLKNAKYGMEFSPSGMQDFKDLDEYTQFDITVGKWLFSGAWMCTNILRQFALWHA